MDRFNQLRAYVAVCDLEGFAAAARALGVSPPVITRAIASLEASLGVKLLHRTTRTVRATDAGSHFLDDARRVLAELAAAEASVRGASAEPQGLVTLTAPALFGRRFVLPIVSEFLAGQDRVQASVTLLDRVVSLTDEGFDMGVRIGPLADSGLRAIPVGQVRTVLCASPGYLDRFGVPLSVSELAAHRLIHPGGGTGKTAWRFGNGASVRFLPRLRANSNDACIGAALDGVGITRVLSYQVARKVLAGDLVLLLEDAAPPPSPINIVHREARYGAAVVRQLVDLLVQRLRADTAVNVAGLPAP